MDALSYIRVKISEKFYTNQRYRNYLPDKLFLECYWRRVWGYEIDWNNLITLNEKIQWLKLYDRKPLYTTLVDKVKVKDWFTSKFGPDHVIPTIATYENLEDINLDELPEEFILKCNHDSGNYEICMNKATFDLEAAKCKFKKALKINYYDIAKEWPYKDINPRVVMCEPLLKVEAGGIPNDYKFHYINGELQFIYVSFDRQGVNDRCTYDENWNRLPFLWIPKNTYREGMNTSDVPCPPTFEDMKKYGSEISRLFKYVRIDFYDVDGKLYFGEITLYHGSGYDTFFPNKYDKIFGDKLKLI